MARPNTKNELQNFTLEQLKELQLAVQEALQFAEKELEETTTGCKDDFAFYAMLKRKNPECTVEENYFQLEPQERYYAKIHDIDDEDEEKPRCDNPNCWWKRYNSYDITAHLPITVYSLFFREDKQICSICFDNQVYHGVKKEDISFQVLGEMFSPWLKK